MSAGALAVEILGESSPWYSGPVGRLQPRGRQVVKQVVQSVQELHRSAPTSPDKHKGEAMSNSTALRGRKSPERKITKAETAERVGFALQAWGKDKSAPIARVQQIAGVDRKTAAAWYHGKSAPLAEHLINLARQIPELKGEVRRLLCMDAELDPGFQQAFAAFMQLVQGGGGQ